MTPAWTFGHRIEGSLPSMSVVIPTRNRSARVAALLRRILADPGDFDVVVVNDRSTDDTREVLAEIVAADGRVRSFDSAGAGGALQSRHQGAEHASGELLVLLDDDVTPMPGLLAGHRARHGAARDLIVLGYIPTVVPEPLPRGEFATLLYAREYEKRCAGYEADPATIMTSLWLGNASIRRDTYLAAFEPGRMPAFPYRHEDRVLGLVLRDLGVRGEFDRTLRADHLHVRTLEAFLRDCYRNGQGHAEIHRARPDVLGEDPELHYLDGLRGPLRSVIAATRHEPVRKP